MKTEAERREIGAAARRLLPRRAHVWAPPAGRADPLAILAAQAATRIPALLPLRVQRMRQSAFAFLRGSAAVMAADLAALPATGLCVQLCGDAHLANFGSYASPEGNPVFDLTDFDETGVGPFEWDVKRLATSFVLAGEAAGLGAGACQALAERSVRHYRRHMERLAGLAPIEAWHSTIDLRSAIADVDHHRLRRRLERHLAAAMAAGEAHYNLVEDGGRRLREGGNTFHAADYAPDIRAAFAAYPATLQPHCAALLGRYALADCALKVVGVGSVGTLCAIALFADADGNALLLQVKEAQASVLAPMLPPPPANQGRRVVEGQRLLQAQSDIFLGWAPEPVAGRFFYVRRLKDSRVAEIGTLLEAETLSFSAALCGRTLARAHGRAGDAARLAGYMGEGEAFDTAISGFAEAYAAQARRDHAAFCAALDQGRLAPRNAHAAA